jgi:aspartate carbamoyltransferase regulatory subunit
MAQFVRAGLAVRDNNHGYRVTVDEYTPMKASAKYTKKDVVKAKPAPKAREPQNDGIAALHPEATSKRVVNTIVFGKTPQEVIKHMNVLQARELYDYLKKVFGG